MKEGLVEEGQLYWLVVCQEQNSPDGPAKFIGPYSEREYALCDIWAAQETHCQNQHYIGHQRWDSERIPNDIGLHWADINMAHRLPAFREQLAPFIDGQNRG